MAKTSQIIIYSISYFLVFLSNAATQQLNVWEFPIITSDKKVIYRIIHPEILDECDQITITIDSVDISFILPGKSWKKKIIPATDSTLEVHQFYSSTWPDSGLFMEIAVDEGLMNFREAAIGLRLLVLEERGIHFALNTPEKVVNILKEVKIEENNNGDTNDYPNISTLFIKDVKMGGKVLIFYEKEETTKSGKQKFIYLDSAMGSFALQSSEDKFSLEILVRMKCPYSHFYNGMDTIMMGIWNSINVPDAYLIKVEE